ncbi:Mor transcription activator family protein [Lachnospiraceae bacterium 54-53]
MSELTIRLADLNDDQLQLAELVGLDTYKKLVLTYGGLNIYIPKTDCFNRKTRNEQIRSEFTGSNFKELAARYGLTDVQIRSIVSDIVEKVRNRPIDGQLNLFTDY